MARGLTIGDASAAVVRRSWYRRQAAALAMPRRHGSKPRLLVDVSLIARHDARTGIQRVVRGIWVALLARHGSTFELVPVVSSRKHGYTAVAFRDIATFAAAESDQPPVEVRKGDIFLGLDLSAHLLPIHTEQVARWKQHGATIAIVCYDLLPQTHGNFFTERTRHHFSRWIEWMLQFADTIFCISNDVMSQIAERISLHTPSMRPTISKLALGGNMMASAPSVGIRTKDASLIERVRDKSSLLMVGTIEPRKGYDRALAAMEKLWAEGFDGDLVIVGKVGWKAQRLVGLLEAHPERGRRLHWIKDASDELLDRLYQVSTGLLVTSHAEGYCLPVSEAAGYGLPVLARDLRVLREHSHASQTFFANDDADSLASAIQSFLVHGGPRSAVGAMPDWDECAVALLRDLGLAGDSVGAQATGLTPLDEPLPKGGL